MKKWIKMCYVGGLVVSSSIVGYDSVYATQSEPNQITQQVDEQKLSQNIEKELLKQGVDYEGYRSAFSDIAPTMNKKWSKEQNLLVLLVEFEDTKLTYDESIWHDKFFKDKENSLRHFYKDETNGLIDIVPAKETNTSEAGIMKVSLDYNHPFPSNNGVATIDERNQKIVRDALIAADAAIDYSSYDKNGNGKIEQDELHIMTIVAGYDFSSAQDKYVYPHQWAIYNKTGLTLDGAEFLYYTQFGEKHLVYQEVHYVDQPMYIGVIAHEFGHDIGLPDLYGPRGLGNLSVMANGSLGALQGQSQGQTPVGLDAYSKMLLGVPVTTVDVTTEDQIVTVNAGNTEENQIIKIPTENPKEYFLIDNRQMDGYDAAMIGYRGAGILGTGIGIYRINENFEHNRDQAGNVVTVLEADEGILGYSNLAQGKRSQIDPFYYVGMGGHKKTQQTVVSKDTVPSTRLSDGSFADVAIEVLDGSSSSMRVKISKPRPVEGIAFDFKEKTLEVGQTLTVAPKFTPENATNKKVSWTSTDSDIASVDTDGKITALKEGETTIKVTSEDGGKTAEFVLTVTKPVIIVEDIMINEKIMYVDPNETKQAPVSLTPENASLDTLNWKIENSSIATVNTAGIVTGKRAGQTKLQVSTKDQSITKEILVLVGDDHPNNREDGTMMDLGNKYYGKNQYTNDYDWLRFDVPVGEYYVVESNISFSTYGYWPAGNRWTSTGGLTLADGKYYQPLFGNENIGDISQFAFHFWHSNLPSYELSVHQVKAEKPTILNKTELNNKVLAVGETIQVEAVANNGLNPNALIYYSPTSSYLSINNQTGEITGKSPGKVTVSVYDVTTKMEDSFTLFVE